MFFISHRGNLNGEEPEYENTTDYINNALSKGFECEIDVWFVKNEFYLGHDTPEEKIDIEFILNNEKNLWIHCKNLECLEKFNDIKDNDLLILDKWILYKAKNLQNKIIKT